MFPRDITYIFKPGNTLTGHMTAHDNEVTGRVTSTDKKNIYVSCGNQTYRADPDVIEKGFHLHRGHPVILSLDQTLPKWVRRISPDEAAIESLLDGDNRHGGVVVGIKREKGICFINDLLAEMDVFCPPNHIPD